MEIQNLYSADLLDDDDFMNAADDLVGEMMSEAAKEEHRLNATIEELAHEKWDEMHAEYQRLRKEYANAACEKCGGKGSLDHYRHVQNGRCFRCGGSGKSPSAEKPVRPEFDRALALVKAELEIS